MLLNSFNSILIILPNILIPSLKPLSLFIGRILWNLSLFLNQHYYIGLYNPITILILVFDTIGTRWIYK